MGDQSGNLFWVRTSQDKVRRKDLCGSVRAVYVLEKAARCKRARPCRGGTLQNGIRADSRGFIGVCRSCAGMVRMARVVLEWSHSMAHALALDTRMWPRGDVPGLGFDRRGRRSLKGVRM